MGHFLRYHLITVIVVTTMLCGCKSRVAPDPESDSTSTITDDVTASQAETTPPERNQQLNPTGLLPLPKNGVQLTVGPFTVPAGQERTMCGFADINVGSDKDIVRIETAMNNGSHHMNLYFSFSDLEKDGTVSCGKDTMAQMIMFGAQLEYHDVPLPNKIALPMPDGQQAILVGGCGLGQRNDCAC